MEKQTQAPKKIELADYKRPDFQVETLELWFDLHEDFCRVRSRMKMRKLSQATKNLVLDGVDLELVSVKLNERELSSGTQDQAESYQVNDEHLTLYSVPSDFFLEIEVKIKPHMNTSLEGLYMSNGSFTTQCEAQGFRKITYFLDRPDVMTDYLVHIEADLKKYPVLLSNGDCVEKKNLSSGRTQVSWRDPFKKPCYLFALVAGDLGVLKDSFITRSGKKITLEIYAPHGKEKKCEFAMLSLKRSMKWDEERFGREYDLSTYMIVAMDDFNAGAMENKGLNIFNSRLVLADPKTATDQNYFSIESVIAHEYFHNWTGNRVTLRDWFHLSLKEGLTVFRDQEFSMDLHNRAVVRIDTVSDLRSGQFAEDAGPNSHPIRPESCFAVDNFFTSTIYEKGSEVIRMMQTMVGRPGFRKGMDLYFERHDGEAVIIEDFANCIAEANQQNWDQFRLWYSQAGTPVVKVTEFYDEKNLSYSLTLEQSCPQREHEKEKHPFHIPMVIGLLNQKTDSHNQLQDQELNLLKTSVNSSAVEKNSENNFVIHLKNKTQTWKWENVSHRPALSLNRSFSAPIHLDWKASTDDLIYLLAHDSDEFNRWEASQKILSQEILRAITTLRSQQKNGETLKLNQPFVPQKVLDAYQSALESTSLGLSLKVKLLELPSIAYLIQLTEEFEPELYKKAIDSVKYSLAESLENQLLAYYKKYENSDPNVWNADTMAERQMKNRTLSFLAELPAYKELVRSQIAQSQSMTDLEASVAIGLRLDSGLRSFASETFYTRFSEDSLTLNKWFALVANSQHIETANQVKELWHHPAFQAKNPNRVYSLLGVWGDNLCYFHSGHGEHYEWMAQRIFDIDQLNPQVATRVASCFDVCSKLPTENQLKAKSCIEKLIAKGLSKNCYEILSRTLSDLS